MKPTKVWKFNDIYSVTVPEENKLHAKVLIDWTSGQALYEGACITLLTAMKALTGNGWTVSDCEHERVGSDPAMQSFSIVNQFADELEAVQLAREFIGILEKLST